jgi:hypothetical protein
MPVHEWSRVPPGTFHDFHATWIPMLKHVLNRQVLPEGYYAMAEQTAGGVIPDVLTLQAVDGPGLAENGSGGTAVAQRPPRVKITARLDQDLYLEKVNHIVIRHRSHDRVVALLELVSPGNKASELHFQKFVEKAVAAVRAGIHLLIIDLHAPSTRDPQGIHGVIWQELGGDEPHVAPSDKPLTLVAYEADRPIQAFVEPIAVGDVLSPMPLFLSAGRYVDVPLEDSYLRAVEEIPARARAPLEK